MTPRPTASPTYAPARTGQFAHVSDYLRVLSRRRWSAGLVLLAVFVAGAIHTLKTTPLYEATAQVLIEKDAQRASTLTTVLDQQDGYTDDDFYQTQYKILQSRTLARHALEVVDPEALAARVGTAPPSSAARSTSRGVTGWLMNLIGAPPRIDPPAADETTAQSEAISDFLGGLTITPIHNTHLVDVTYQSPDPVRAAGAANAVSKQYIAQSLESRLLASKDATAFLEQQLFEQKQKVEDSDRALQNYKETHDAVALDDKQNTVVQKLAEISAQVTQAQGDRIAKEAVYSALQKAQDDPEKLQAFPAILQNPTVQTINAELRQLTQDRVALAMQHGLNHPLVQQQDKQIQAAQTRLNAEIQRVVDSIRSEYQTAVAKEQALRQAQDDEDKNAMVLNKKSVDFTTLQRDALSNRTLYDTLLQRTKETGVAGEFKGSNLQIVDAAELPREPVLPRTSRDLAISAVLGLSLGFLVAFGLEYLDNRIRTPDEIKTHLGLPFLGIVPSVAREKDGPEAPPILLDGDVPPAFAEAIRAIRTAVVFSSADEGARSVVVTSAAPGEGKTLISTNLAVALARAGQRTLIIDADMRRPRVHAVFGAPQEPGLSNALVGTTPLFKVIRPTRTPQLSVIPAGHIPPNPAELLGSNRYLEVMADIEQQFDWIIVDAPPIMAVTDAAIVANRSTGVIYVVGAEMTSRSAASRAVEQLANARAKFIGAVLNRVKVEKHSYYYSPYYRKDYSRVYERTN